MKQTMKYVVRLNLKGEGFVGIVSADSKQKLREKVRAHAKIYGFENREIEGRCVNTKETFTFVPNRGVKPNKTDAQILEDAGYDPSLLDEKPEGDD